MIDYVTDDSDFESFFRTCRQDLKAAITLSTHIRPYSAASQDYKTVALPNICGAGILRIRVYAATVNIASRMLRPPLPVIRQLRLLWENSNHLFSQLTLPRTGMSRML